MFSWGERCRHGFRLKDGTYTSEESCRGVSYLDLGFSVTHLSAGLRALAFVKSNGNAFIIRTNESQDGTRAGGKQKCLECKEKMRAVSCTDDVVVLLTKRGQALFVDTTRGKGIPRPLDGLRGVPVSQVSCGSQHSIALTKDGQVFTWGLNSRGQLGLGKSQSSATSPQHVTSLSDLPLVQVAAGGDQSFSLSVSGSVFGWGGNSCGQLGLGDTIDRHSPTVVHYLNMKKTCHISCGHTHTAALTKEGAVFTFGSGQQGQLGHNSFRDELRPRLVAELWGSKVLQVACGRQHTLVLTETQRVFSFGCGDLGQLGHGEESHPAVPLPVSLPPEHSEGLEISNIYAGANCSYATCLSQNIQTESSVTTQGQPCLEDLIHKWTSASKPWKQTKQEIYRIFSSAQCLNRSFLEQSGRKDKHFETSTKYSGLDLSAAQSSFTKLLNNGNVLKEVEAAALSLLPSLNESPVGVEALRLYLLLTELLVVLHKHRAESELAEKLAHNIQSLSKYNQQVLKYWWSTLSYPTRQRHVDMLRQTLAKILSSVSPNFNINVILKMVKVFEEMYNINSEMIGDQKLPEAKFGLELSEKVLQDDVSVWHSVQTTKRRYENAQLVFCHHPFIMDLQAKKKAFDLNSNLTKTEHQAPQQMCFNWFLGWVSQSQPDFFYLNLKRTSLVEDTFEQLAASSDHALKKTLIVHFDGDSKITEVYKKDLFHHVFLEIVSSDSEMLVFNESKTLAWFPSKMSKKKKKSLFLFGKLCGLALYNQSIISLPFPLALFKKLLDVKPSLDDLIELSPSVGQSLQYILDYEEDVQGLDMFFTVVWDGTEVELDTQNPGKPVTNDNKVEFVEAYVNHVFNTSVKSAFEEFRRGFFGVCDQYSVKLFRPEELRGVMVGSEIYDWITFRQKTVYELEYHTEHPTIRMFWEVFQELNDEQKKDFLWFLTGFRRVPIFGLSQIQMKVRVKFILHGLVDDHFPESLTCHSILELPLYSTKEVMKKRVTEAIIPETGFRR